MNLSESPTCQMCLCNSDESIEHFLLQCSGFSSIRNNYITDINEYLSFTFPGLCFTQLSSFDKIQILVGDCFYQVDLYISKTLDSLSKKIFSKNTLRDNWFWNLNFKCYFLRYFQFSSYFYAVHNVYFSYVKMVSYFTMYQF